MLNKVKTMIITIMVLSVIIILINNNAQAATKDTAQAATIEVKKGDTLWDLSHEHYTTVEKIKEWNQLHTDLISTGKVSATSPEASYTVKNGDTLWAIAMAYHITVSQLMERNTLTSDLIHPGLILVIPTNENQSNLVQLGNSPHKIEAVQIHKKTVTKVAAAATSVPSSGKVITVTATAYTPWCTGCSGITATGINVKSNPNAKIIAVDPSIIPLGTKVYIEGFGTYTAADTGGAIKGFRIDVLMPSERAAVQFGRKHLKITILN